MPMVPFIEMQGHKPGEKLTLKHRLHHIFNDNPKFWEFACIFLTVVCSYFPPEFKFLIVLPAVGISYFSFQTGFDRGVHSVIDGINSATQEAIRRVKEQSMFGGDIPMPKKSEQKLKN